MILLINKYKAVAIVGVIVVMLAIILGVSLNEEDEATITMARVSDVVDSNVNTGEDVKIAKEKLNADEEDIARLKLDWQKKCDKEEEDLKYILKYGNNEDVIKKAESDLLTLSNNRALEDKCESMLSAKNYNNVLVMVNNANLTAVLCKDFANEDAVVIADVLLRCSGFKNENIILVTQ